MIPRVEKTSLAEADVISIWVYIAQDNPDAATEVLRRIEDRPELDCRDAALR